jgi:hypothetical protein
MAVQWTVIIKNGGGSPVTINDLGIAIPATGQVTMSTFFEFAEIAGSEDLRDLVTAETLVVNDGSSDLTAANGLKWITEGNLKDIDTKLATKSDTTHDHDLDYAPLSHTHDDRYYTESEVDTLLGGYALVGHDHDLDYAPLSHTHDDRYYTETELQTSGQSQVHWGNITNAPSFGSPTWVDPVQYRVRGVRVDPPGTPVAGDAYVSKDTYEQWNLEITGACTSSGNVTVILAGGTPVVVALTNGDAINDVATKIRNASYTGWAAGGTGANVTFTATTYGDKTGTFSYTDTDTTGATGTLGNVIQGSVKDRYMTYYSAAWHDISAAVSGDRVINLVDAEQTIYAFNGTAWTDTNLPTEDNVTAIVEYDYDSATTNWTEAMYVYDSDTDTWKLIGRMNFSGHLDGGSNKHDASEIDVEGTYSNIPGTPTNLESVISAINTALGAAEESLDSAYDYTGSGAGRTITADSGSVKIDTASATNAPLELVNKSSAPSTGLAAGQLAVIGNILYAYDGGRSKWLSVERKFITFNKDGSCKDQFLRIAGGQYSNLGGFRMARNATIVGLSVQLSASGTGTFQVQKNGGGSALESLTVTAATGAQDVSVNVDTDVSEGDYLQAYESGAASVSNPTFLVEVAWRP